MLLAKKHPEATTSDLATRVGFSARTATRLFARYRNAGLEGVMKRGSRSSGLRVDPAEPVGLESQEEDAWKGSLLSQVMELAARVPLTIDARQWLIEMREALLGLFPEVDYIVIRKVTDIDLFNPSISSRDIYIRESFTGVTRTPANDSYQRKEKILSGQNGSAWKNLLKEGIEEGRIDASRYHSPEGRDYYYRFNGGATLLGSIILFRNVGRPPLSQETLYLLDAIEPLMTRLLSEAAARYQVHNPDALKHIYLFDIVDGEVSLTDQERNVLVGHTTGHSTSEIAEIMCISEETVKSHTHAILRKTGRKTIKEVIASILSPRQSYEHK